MKKITALFMVFALIFSLTACTTPNYASSSERSDKISKEIKLIKDESIFDNFEIDGVTVNITCELTFKNTSENEETFYLVGDFKEEYESGLVKERSLRGINYEDKNEKLTLKPHQKKTFVYVFKGNHGSGDQMANRLLPKIKIYEIIE